MKLLDQSMLAFAVLHILKDIAKDIVALLQSYTNYVH